MDIFLFAVIVLQLGYMVFSDIKNREERTVLQFKLMGEPIPEKKSTESSETKKEEEDPYISIEEAGVEQLLKAKERR